jgi:hypothetical protein
LSRLPAIQVAFDESFMEAIQEERDTVDLLDDKCGLLTEGNEQ